MADYRFSWFRYSDHTWHGEYLARMDAARASVSAQPFRDGGKTIAFNGYLLGEKRLDSESIVRFEVNGDGPVSRNIDVIQSSV